MITPDFVFFTSFYQGEAYLKRFCRNVRWISRYLQKKSLSHAFVIVLNDPASITLQGFKDLTAGYPVDLICTDRETVYASWNRALIKYRESKAFAVWNMDDVRFPKASLEQAHGLIQSSRPAYSTFPFWQFESNKRRFHFRFYKRNAVHLNPTPFLAFNKLALDELGFFNPYFRISGDREWYYRAINKNCEYLSGKSSIGILVNYGVGLSTSTSPHRICENMIIQELFPEYDPNAYFPYYEEMRKQIVEKK